MKYSGLLGALAEAVDIQAEHDCSAEEAHAIQRSRCGAAASTTRFRKRRRRATSFHFAVSTDERA